MKTMAQMCIVNQKALGPSQTSYCQDWQDTTTLMPGGESPSLREPSTQRSLPSLDPAACGVSSPLSGDVPMPKEHPGITPFFSLGPCQNHPSHDREFYCQTDQSFLCIKCVILDHNKHDVKTIMQDIQGKLQQRLKVLQKKETYLQDHLRLRQSSTDFFRSTVHTLKDRVLKQLGGLTTETEEESQRIVRQLDDTYLKRVSDDEIYNKYVNEKIESFQCLQEQVKKALECKSIEEFLSHYNQKLANDSDLKLWLEQLHSSLHLQTSDLFLFLEDTPQDAAMTPDLARVSQMTAKIAKVFTCSDDSPVLVNSICVNSDGYVIVAYRKQDPAVDATQDSWVAKFTRKGKSDYWEPQATKGRVCLTALQEGVVLVEGEDFPPMKFHSQFFDILDNSSESKLYDVYSKLNARFLIRKYSQSGECQIRSVSVDGSSTTDELLFHIKATHPVAMDASRDGHLFAVLDKDHSVKLYRYEQQSTTHDDQNQETEPCAIYTGNGKAFKPHDICFFPIGGKERLVVADWLNGLLHVVDVTDGCDMIGQVGRDCLDLGQPTALCPDEQGHLWIGCQGGRVLTLTYPY